VLEARPGAAGTRLVRVAARLALAEKALASGRLEVVKAAVEEIEGALAASPEPWRLKLMRGRLKLMAAVVVRKDREACAEWLKGVAEDMEGALSGPMRLMALEVRAHARLVEARVLGKTGAAEACLADVAELGEEAVALALRGQARAVLAKTKEERAAALEELKRAFAAGVARTGMIAEIAEELEKTP
jgi:hypothetical protein